MTTAVDRTSPLQVFFSHDEKIIKEKVNQYLWQIFFMNIGNIITDLMSCSEKKGLPYSEETQQIVHRVFLDILSRRTFQKHYERIVWQNTFLQTISKTAIAVLFLAKLQDSHEGLYNPKLWNEFPCLFIPILVEIQVLIK